MDLGNLVGVTMRTVRGWETGGKYPRYRHLYSKIAEAHGCEVDNIWWPNRRPLFLKLPNNMAPKVPRKLNRSWIRISCSKIMSFLLDIFWVQWYSGGTLRKPLIHYYLIGGFLNEWRYVFLSGRKQPLCSLWITGSQIPDIKKARILVIVNEKNFIYYNPL